jgi:lactate permease
MLELSPIIPIAWLLVSLGFLKLPAYKACLIGLAISGIEAISLWQMDYLMALKAAAEGSVFALLPIIWVIVAAFFTYNISLHTGAITQIKQFMSSLSGDRRIQALLIAWGFGGFLEAVAGFGTAVAVPAALLIALGFEPFLAAVVCLFANTTAVAFGVVGIPVNTLAQITELPILPISMAIVWQLAPFGVLVPLLIVVTITKSLKRLHGVWLTTLVSGISFALAQFVVAKYVGPELPAIIGSIVAFLATVLSAKMSPPAEEWKFPQERAAAASVTKDQAIDVKQQMVAWMPYILLLVFVLLTSKLVPILNGPLGKVTSAFLIYDGTGGKPLTLQWLLTPGTLVLVSAIIGGLIQGASLLQLAKLYAGTAWQLRKTAVTIMSIVSMAKVLGYSGMIGSIAVTLAGVTGPLYPLFAPAIGALGTFITGSDTSANILFGLLQKQTALQLGIDPIWIAAANASGACIGKLISPQSIAIAAIATGLTGKEGELLAVTAKYAAIFLIVLGGLTYGFAFL